MVDAWANLVCEFAMSLLGSIREVHRREDALGEAVVFLLALSIAIVALMIVGAL
jgi:uncharacterized membrane protein